MIISRTIIAASGQFLFLVSLLKMNDFISLFFEKPKGIIVIF